MIHRVESPNTGTIRIQLCEFINGRQEPVRESSTRVCLGDKGRSTRAIGGDGIGVRFTSSNCGALSTGTDRVVGVVAPVVVRIGPTIPRAQRGLEILPCRISRCTRRDEDLSTAWSGVTNRKCHGKADRCRCRRIVSSIRSDRCAQSASARRNERDDRSRCVNRAYARG